MTKRSLAHITHPVFDKDNKDSEAIQNIAFETMKIAKSKADNIVDVEQYVAYYPEDEKIVPSYLKKTKPLTRSAYVIKSFHLKQKRPLLKDILDRLYQNSNADYFILSSPDVALMPEFYTEVNKLIDKGIDGFVIKNKIVKGDFCRIEQIPQMFKENGEENAGFNAFVFPRKIYKKFILANSCARSNWTSRILISNIFTYSNEFNFVKEKKLIFCSEKAEKIRTNTHQLFHSYNEQELLKVLVILMKEQKAKNSKIITNFYNFHNKYDPTILLSNNNQTDNRPKYKLQDKPENIYHKDFRHSSSWLHFKHQRLRQDPIFVIGQEQLHVNFIHSIINSNSKIYSIPNLHFFDVVKKQFEVENDSILFDSIDRTINVIRKIIPFSINAEEYIIKLSRNKSLSPKMLYEIVVIDNMIENVKPKNINRTIWMEKSAVNIDALEIITRFYPEARIIAVISNPISKIVSLKNSGQLIFSDQTYKDKFDETINQWLQKIQEIEKYKNLKPDNFHIIKIEELAKNIEEEAKKIYKFIDIPYHQDSIKINEGFLKKVSQYKSYEMSLSEKVKLYKKAKGKMMRYGYGSLVSELKVNLCHHLLNRN